MSLTTAYQAEARATLRELRDRAQRALPTESDHAIPHHRAHEWLRDTLEEVLHEEQFTPDDNCLCSVGWRTHGLAHDRECPEWVLPL